jgi:hypothetical protein
VQLLIPIVLAIVVGSLAGLSVIGATGPRVPASF